MSYRLLKTGVQRIADSLIITRSMREWDDYRAWLKAGNSPLPMEPPPVYVPPLVELKAEKIRQLRADALAAVNVHLPDATDVSTLILLRELYLSIAPAARQPTAAMGKLIGIYQAMQAAIDSVRACESAACVLAIPTPTWP